MNIFTKEYGENKTAPLIIWGHGWGQSHAAFEPLITTLKNAGQHIALDFPGFGQSPAPDEPWGTKDYADKTAALIRDIKSKNPERRIFWAGHSFGCRVALQLGAHYPDLLDGYILIAGAGLKPKRPPIKAAKIWLKIRFFKILKPFVTHPALTPVTAAPANWIMSNILKVGSRDYNAATNGILRKIFVRVVNEDLTPEAAQIKAPTVLLYGANDTETPPEIGQRLHKLINKSELYILDGLDHYSILTTGRHIIAQKIVEFIKAT